MRQLSFHNDNYDEENNKRYLFEYGFAFFLRVLRLTLTLTLNMMRGCEVILSYFLYDFTSGEALGLNVLCSSCRGPDTRVELLLRKHTAQRTMGLPVPAAARSLRLRALIVRALFARAPPAVSLTRSRSAPAAAEAGKLMSKDELPGPSFSTTLYWLFVRGYAERSHLLQVPGRADPAEPASFRIHN